jgi:uncharacterized repeat protein (TIGR01451 family)
VRLNRHWLGQTCSGRWVFVAVPLLMVLAVIALTMGSSAAKLETADHSKLNPNPANFFASAPVPPATQTVHAAYSHLPLMFEPNQGQTDPSVKFLARGSGYGLYLTADDAVLTLQHPGALRSASSPSVVRMRLASANASATVTGTDELPGKSNYFIGNDPAKWHRDIPQFARVRYSNVYPGIDLVYYGNQGRLEYDFEVAPGSDPKQVALKFQGPENLAVDVNGDLVLVVGGSDLRLHAPRIYQKFGAEERTVAGRFAFRGAKDEVGFELGTYDRTRTLIIDPVLTYSTYLGGSGIESCSAITGLPFTPGCPAIAVDAVSNVYVAGSTTSTDFPPQPGVLGKLTGTANVFVAKFSPTGNTLQFATYLGGSAIDYTAGIAIDNGFNIVVAGTTTSSDFPTDGTNAAFQATPGSGSKHVFVSKLDSTGHTLLYSTYLSGNGADIAAGVALDPGGNAHVTGTTASSNFPTTVGALQTTPKATNQFFYSRVDPNTSGTGSLLYSTYIGGSNPSTGVTFGGGIAVDINSNAYITGGTNFIDMPVLNAYQATLQAGLDIFVTRINPAAVSGAQLIYSTYFGGTGDDIGYGIAVDSSTNAYVTGSTTSGTVNFIPPSGTTELQANNGGGTDAFVVKFGIACVPTPTTTCTTPLPVSYFTFLGGSGLDTGTSIGVDGNQGARITGWTQSQDFPRLDPVQAVFGGGTYDAFVARIDTLATCSPIATPPPACAITGFSSFFGGTGEDMGTSLAVDQQGSTFLTGETTSSTGLPLANSFQTVLDGPSDAFVAKLGPTLSLTMAQPTVSPSVVGVGGQVTFTYTITNSGDFTNGITFSDNLEASGSTFVSAVSSPGSCGQPTGTPPTVLCNIGTLNAAATATVTVVVTAVAPPISGGSVVLGNSGAAGINGLTLMTASGSAIVNDYSLQVGPASATVPAGVPAVFTATVTPSANNGFPGSVTLSCSTALPTGATCLPGSNNPIPNLNTGAQSAQLVINTTARVTTTTGHLHGIGRTPFYALFLPVSGLAMLGVGLSGRGSRRRRLLMLVLLGGFFALILFQPACSSSKQTSLTTGTPAGTYPLTISATSGTGATRTQLVTLIVQ